MKLGTAPGLPFYILLSVYYKLFTEIILTRMSRTLDEAQPDEQAGFRQGFSYMNHIQTLSRVGIPPVPCSNLRPLDDQNVDAPHARTLANFYDRCTTRIQLFQRLLTILTERGYDKAISYHRSCLLHLHSNGQ
ncbi:hypothetical protein RB195_021301 [Necator americanus]|uniref:Reverse transcriptase domain-containing protein n=1 Tax=Necator americanus TaxID=51031 RepID=A0ABR1EAA4_NECAM